MAGKVNVKKSAVSLQLAHLSEARKNPEPPSHLTVQQAAVWRMVLATRACEMIDPEAFPLLVEYCRAVEVSDQISSQLEQFNPSFVADEDGLKRWDRLMQMQARNAGSMSTLASKLRIAPNARMRQENAGTIARKGKKVTPWLVDENES